MRLTREHDQTLDAVVTEGRVAYGAVEVACHPEPDTSVIEYGFRDDVGDIIWPDGDGDLAAGFDDEGNPTAYLPAIDLEPSDVVALHEAATMRGLTLVRRGWARTAAEPVTS